MVSSTGILFLGLFGVIGVVIIGVGIVNMRKWWTMRNLDPANATAVDEGLQEIEGRAQPIDGTVTAPFTGTESLVCEYKVEDYRHDDDGSNWHTETQDTLAVPFEVIQGGSTIAVHPEKAQELLTKEFQVDTGRTNEYPAGVREYFDGGETVELGPIELNSRGGRHRFTENRLEPGEEVYVLGSVKRDPSAVPAGSEARVAINPPERTWKDRLFGDPFVISDSGEETAQWRQLKRSLLLIGFGVLFVGFASAPVILPGSF